VKKVLRAQLQTNKIVNRADRFAASGDIPPAPMSVNDPTNIVELTFPADGLEFEFNRRIIEFHISPDTFNRGTGVRLLGRSEPILGGALPIWGPLAISLNSLAGP